MSAEHEEDVIVCRCEEVTLGQIRRALAGGLTSPLELKGRLRVGMGLCAGRTCRDMVTELAAAARGGAVPAPLSYRPPVRPVALQDLCNDVEEG